MTRPLLFNAFLMNTPSHIQHGQWRHPDARQTEFEGLDLWIDLARTLERGLFDAMFFADVSGLYGPADGVYTDNVHEGLQIPSNDPTVLLGALAAVTERIGLATTSNVMQNHPFNFARQISTLDHLSKGRAAWNIVTSTQENAARNFGLPALVEHDARYEWAEEYVDVAYKLWEGSWDEDAVLVDREGGRYADPAKIHKIFHSGERYRVEGPHLPAPSPQRTPLLFQAGGSPRGIAFAARHAEAVFIAPPNPEVARDHIAKTRAQAVSAGRRADDIRFFPGMSFVIGSTEAEAKAKEAELLEYASDTGYTTHASLGIRPDGSRLPSDTPLSAIPNNGGRGHVEWLRAGLGREPVLGDLARERMIGRTVVGTPDQIADSLETWRDAGVDGINVVNWRLPDSYEEFIDDLLPTLQERGLAKTEYGEATTLRGRIFGTDRLPERHPAAQYRGAFGEDAAAGWGAAVGRGAAAGQGAATGEGAAAQRVESAPSSVAG
ncbi:LLM class flavin-dependent oxidoreductase [Brevibacterium jeotgali]|uniref:FMN-dependent oxidoreductase, nitrilotriacetate monooxygenase family n=1 Tax=Brevibacterium jeotgali TaxID=1262550 RepID=A0A2H1L5Y7_9MICO|nr:LLM class flavin-dependent oxidoreductase [Brevibacterium jeotgali]TWB98852.1 FMN-dependent oxidoreductase (nitrilotriacetate monooxygenase family) [Brevibacterium jeotgali]SMY12318.1 FMN-dependent oxidoreductase, nitrilotriacetate monooxygenase family [Brevibacterium jeotgali]